jgi:hypothetical protein
MNCLSVILSALNSSNAKIVLAMQAIFHNLKKNTTAFPNSWKNLSTSIINTVYRIKQKVMIIFSQFWIVWVKIFQK